MRFPSFLLVSLALGSQCLGLSHFTARDGLLDLYARQLDDLSTRDIHHLYQRHVASLYERDADALAIRDGSALSKRTPVKVTGDTVHLGRGGQSGINSTSGPPKLQIDGLDSGWGVLAVGPNMAYGAHIAPGKEVDKEVKSLDAALRRSRFLKAHFLFPIGGDSKIFGQIAKAFSEAGDNAIMTVKMTGYRVGWEPKKHTLNVGFEDGSCSVTIDGYEIEG